MVKYDNSYFGLKGHHLIKILCKCFYFVMHFNYDKVKKKPFYAAYFKVVLYKKCLHLGFFKFGTKQKQTFFSYFRKNF